ncbi:Xaa-Pro peptidase family protein (plasmid) [Deinococcus sp. KNUC1210]|uniref:M24 family metallopeptidase n=1 Tax=Deinococcus sp. KNUC1210 TaxID=2917691 RepID=UPI001EF0F5E5|nr:Xaa-Pro peptidase family protein [Deinococcus sp. KNUC1210]ULH16994.1 Xaa-Pro peptidase family protein [Deinococcus sp. KNUC1210]
MSALGEEKARQATQQLHSGELWLFLTQEGSDPNVGLVFGTNSVGKAAFMLDNDGPKALVSRIDAGHFEQHSTFLTTRTYAASFENELTHWLQELAPHTLLLNFSEHDVRCDGLTHGQYLSLEKVVRKALPDVQIVSSEERLSRVRAIKSPEELRRLQRAIDLTTVFYDRLLPTVQAGQTEREIQARMNALAAELGAAPDPGDFGGPLVLINRVGMSHRAPTDEALRPGDLLILDTALGVEGYFSDIARTIYLLRDDEDAPPQRERQVFAAIYGAIDAAYAVLRPGALGYQVDAAARQHLLNLGYPEIQHSTGHQIGRHVHDGGAVLGPRGDNTRRAPGLSVEAGMIFTLEPTILMSPDPSMIVEENVLVTEDGPQYLSTRQQQLWTAR